MAVTRAEPKPRKKEPELFLNRELSWLEFNSRVLEEAMDPTTPLLDRLKFAIIVSTNLDEFFMVRVAALKHAIDEGDANPDAAGLRPRQQLIVVSERAHEMVERLGKTLTEEILPPLAERGIRFVSYKELEEPQRAFLGRYFTAEMLPALTPLAIDVSRPFPQLANLSLNLAILLAPPEGEDQPRLAVVQVPAGLRRLVRPLGGDGNTYVLLEEIIRAEMATLFPGQNILEASAFRIARDAEMELDEEGGRAYLEAIEDELRKRRLSRVVRLEVEQGMGDTLLGILVQRLEIEVPDVYYVRGPLDVRALWPLVELPALEQLREPALKPQLPVEALTNMIARVAEGEILLHHPYESFDPVIAFVSQAAADPDVLAIKQTLYRTSGDSPIVQALSRAAEAGKQVTVIVELMARFDEQSNIKWARSLEQSGAHVIYGIRGYKTHAKICLVVRRGPQGIERYVHMGTGNYNEKTARIYTDFGDHDRGPGHRRGRLRVLQRPHRVLGPSAHEEAVHGPHHPARAVRAPHPARAAPGRRGPARGDPGQDELARGRGDDPRPLRREQGRREDPPQRARHLLPASGGEGGQRNHRGGLGRRPLPRALAGLPLPQRRRRRGLPGQRGLDAAQP